jgi:putative intracellular protease/amidase
MLVQNGGKYTKGADWEPYVVTDGLLVTGQNPASSEPAARALLRLLD